MAWVSSLAHSASPPVTAVSAGAASWTWPGSMNWAMVVTRVVTPVMAAPGTATSLPTSSGVNPAVGLARVREPAPIEASATSRPSPQAP